MSVFTDIKYRLYKKRLVYKGKRTASQTEIEPMKDPIDFVVTWVDGSDPDWIAENNEYKRKLGIQVQEDINGECRYRDWDIFQYWFRAVEKYAPWVNRVYLVTCGQVPKWLNIHAPKLKLVNHKDFIPICYLPTFSCNPIELNLHRIDGLSEHFVYFNDDVFLNRPVLPQDFFGDGPNYTAVAQPLMANGSNDTFTQMRFTTLATINGKFKNKISKKMEAHPEKWFTKEYGEYYLKQNLYAFDQGYLPGMLFSHLGVAFKRSVWERVWERIPEQLHKTCLNTFRTPTDVLHQVFSIWAMLEGDFHPVSKDYHGRVFAALTDEQEKITDAIVNERYRMICINDSERLAQADYLTLKTAIKEAFDRTLPVKSAYEI